MSKPVPWALAPVPASSFDTLRRCAVRVLRQAATRLWRLSRRLHRVPQVPAAERVLEFHAEAGAPEGALFVDGVRVGTLPGIQRL